MKILKKSHNAEKTGREDPLGFFNIHSVAKLKKMKGDPLVEKFFRKKVAQRRKKTRPIMLRGKKQKPFWFSSLCQQVQFKIL